MKTWRSLYEYATWLFRYWICTWFCDGKFYWSRFS